MSNDDPAPPAPLRLILEHERVALFHGDSSLLDLPENSVDAIICDPPAAIAFMGRSWDDDRGGYDGWTRWLARVLAPAVRALKPGGAALLWALPRTSHWTARAVELAGLEIRDVHHDVLSADEVLQDLLATLDERQRVAMVRVLECAGAPIVYQIFGTGFPKSADISKAIDASDAGRERRRRSLVFTAWMRSTGITAARVNELTGTNMGSHYLTDKEQPCVAVALLFDQLRPHLPPVPAEIEALVAERTVESENMARREVDHRGGAASRVHEGFSFGEDFARTAAFSPEAVRWTGYGTALKPSVEHWILARKPLEGTYADNVLRHGTGALNIDACRIGTAGESFRAPQSDPANRCSDSGLPQPGRANAASHETMQAAQRASIERTATLGRWPAHLSLRHTPGCELAGTVSEQVQTFSNVGEVHRDGDESTNLAMGRQTATGHATVEGEVYRCAPGCPVAELDAQSGERKSGARRAGVRQGRRRGQTYGDQIGDGGPEIPTSAGGASRFFLCTPPFKYVAKPSRREKDAGLAHLAATSGGEATDREDGSAGLQSPRAGAGRTGGAKNSHETVKSISLMEWLIRLVVPDPAMLGRPGVILDPFAGSGTTGVAALGIGHDFIGAEQGGDGDRYIPILLGRIKHALQER